jgi:hypothetical protein
MWRECRSIDVFFEYQRRFGNRHPDLREALASAPMRPAKKFAANLKIEKQELLAEVRMAAA